MKASSQFGFQRSRGIRITTPNVLRKDVDHGNSILSKHDDRPLETVVSDNEVRSFQVLSDQGRNDTLSSFRKSGRMEIIAPNVLLEYSDESGSDMSDDDVQLLDMRTEPRLLDPAHYFKKLKDLELKVFEHSAFKFLIDGASTSTSKGKGEVNNIPGITLHIPNAKREQRPPHVSDVLLPESFDNMVPDERLPSRLYHLRESRNLMLGICSSVQILQSARYCEDRVSFLRRNSSRPNIAVLTSVNMATVFRLARHFEEALQRLTEMISTTTPEDRNEVERLATENLTLDCVAFLASVGLPPAGVARAELLWRSSAHLMDLIVLSYAGAHIERVDERYLGRTSDAFLIPRSFTKDHWRNDLVLDEHIITMRRRRLRCLDGFLGRKEVWIFEPASAAEDDSPLYLSTDVDNLADIWGPLWSCKDNSDSTYHHSIGNGFIVPWTQNKAADQVDPVSVCGKQEVFCHWVSSLAWNEDEVLDHQQGVPRSHFDSGDILLIGASTVPSLHENEECVLSRSSLRDIKDGFRQEDGLRRPQTLNSARVKDSSAYQFQRHIMGFASFSDTITYKRRAGQTMKAALVERWRNGSRSLVDLEGFYGVEVSLCTGNARRRRLRQLLSSPTMRNFLKTISFEWPCMDCELKFFAALRKRKTFWKFWVKHPEWQYRVGNAISRCLDELQETGIDEDTKELRCLWVDDHEEEDDDDNGENSEDGSKDDSGDEQERSTPSYASGFDPADPWIVALSKSEYTWTGFLQDSSECLTMAIMHHVCLELRDCERLGRRCGSQSSKRRPRQSQKVPERDYRVPDQSETGFPALQTSIWVNESILEERSLARYVDVEASTGRKPLDAAKLPKGYGFNLGDHGRLVVSVPASQQTPLLMVWKAVASKEAQRLKNFSINKVLGRSAQKHQEHFGGAWTFDPLPVLILSDSTKVQADRLARLLFSGMNCSPCCLQGHQRHPGSCSQCRRLADTP